MGFLVAQMAKNLPPMQESRLQFLGWEDPLEKGMVLPPVFLPGESQDRGARWATQLMGWQSWTGLSDTLLISCM